MLFCGDGIKYDDERKTATICRNTKRSREERKTKTANVDIKMCVECACNPLIYIIIGSRNRLPPREAKRRKNKLTTFVSVHGGCRWFAAAAVTVVNVPVATLSCYKMNMQYPLIKIEIDSEQIFSSSFIPFPFLFLLVFFSPSFHSSHFVQHAHDKR